MKRSFLSAVFCVAFALALPAAARRYLPRKAAPPSAAAVLSTAAPERTRDSEITLRVQTDGGVTEMTMAEYLPGVLAGEMPLSFAPAALEAQAAAARTYALYRRAHADGRHPEADVCGDPACCQVWLSEEQLRSAWGEDFDSRQAAYAAAVKSTDGAVLLWEGEPILACFHAASDRRTESSGAVWGSQLPYLVSVDSPEGPETVPDFVTTAELSEESFRAMVAEKVPQADLSGPPEQWVTEAVTDESGRVASLRVGGTELTGTQIRRIFALRSACFTLEHRDGSFLFTVRGSGHGVGMSQYGADVMARGGSTPEEILSHYYPGAALVRLGDQPASLSGS